jgi:hypothetical protein
MRRLRAALAAVLILSNVSLAGCDAIHGRIYNLSGTPIFVTFSAAGVGELTVLIQPQDFTGVFGSAGAVEREITVLDAAGRQHSYDTAALAALRPAGAADDRWGWYSDGLHFIGSDGGSLL